MYCLCWVLGPHEHIVLIHIFLAVCRSGYPKVIFFSQKFSSNNVVSFNFVGHVQSSDVLTHLNWHSRKNCRYQY